VGVWSPTFRENLLFPSNVCFHSTFDPV
jgi:hypothetical protein